MVFLSTLSLRRATHSLNLPSSPIDISIHALLAESDLVVTAFPGSADRFLSTLSLRRATNNYFATLYDVDISIHALLAESDFREVAEAFWMQKISIHALLAESDL